MKLIIDAELVGGSLGLLVDIKHLIIDFRSQIMAEIDDLRREVDEVKASFTSLSDRIGAIKSALDVALADDVAAAEVRAAVATAASDLDGLQAAIDATLAAAPVEEPPVEEPPVV